MTWRHAVAWLLLLTLCAGLRPAITHAGGYDREAVIQELFTLNRRLEQTRAALAELESQLQQVSTQQAEAHVRHEQLAAQRKSRMALYGKRLRYYRERGNRSPYYLLLRANSLSDFFWRLSVLQQIMAHDARLVRELRELQASVAAEERTLAEARTQTERLQADQLTQAVQLERAIAEREAILAGLGDDRQEVETALAAVEDDWEGTAQPILEALGAALQEMGTDEFEPDDMRFTLLPPGVVVRISAQRLTDYFHGWSELTGLEVRMAAEEFHLIGAFDEVPIRIEGGFRVLPGGLLRFEPKVMQVRDFPVPRATIDEILALGQLDIDISSVVKPLTLQAIQVSDGVLTIRAGAR